MSAGAEPPSRRTTSEESAPRAEVDERSVRQLIRGSSRPLGLLAGAAVLLVILGMERPDGLSAQGQSALAVFGLCVIYWVTRVVPLMVTSLMVLVLLPATGALTTREAYGLFGNEALFFILGVFILAATLMKCGLSTRIAIGVLRRFGHSPRTLLLTFYLLNAAMAFIMSEHAVAAMTFPIAVEIARVLGLQRRRNNYARGLFLALAWGSSIGGLATLLGGGRAPLAIGILREATGESFSFAGWMLLTWPLVVVLLVAGWFIMNWFFPIDITSTKAADAVIAERAFRLGRPSVEERVVGLVIVATLVAWFTLGEEFGLASIALAAVVVLFGVGMFRWRAIEDYVDWGVVLMYGGAIVLGGALARTGAASWLADLAVRHGATSPVALVALLSGLGIVLSEAMSNSAVVALLLPAALGLAEQFGIDPRIMAPAIALPAGISFTLPIGTPANAIAYSSGYLQLRDMVVPGCILAVLAWVTFNVVANWYWPLVGLKLAVGPT
jgi:sodium-dependent dicarboxylate transporter 2/3/5